MNNLDSHLRIPIPHGQAHGHQTGTKVTLRYVAKVPRYGGKVCFERAEGIENLNSSTLIITLPLPYEMGTVR